MQLAQQPFEERSAVGVNSRLLFCRAQASLFRVPAFSEKMAEIAARHLAELRSHHDRAVLEGRAPRSRLRRQQRLPADQA